MWDLKKHNNYIQVTHTHTHTEKERERERERERETVEMNAGGVAWPWLDPSDVRGATSGRRHAFHGRSALLQGVEPADQEHSAARPGPVSLHDQHQSRQEQSHHAARQRLLLSLQFSFSLCVICHYNLTNIHLFYDVYLMEHTNCLCLLLLLLFTGIVCSIFCSF